MKVAYEFKQVHKDRILNTKGAAPPLDADDASKQTAWLLRLGFYAIDEKTADPSPAEKRRVRDDMDARVSRVVTA